MIAGQDLLLRVGGRTLERHGTLAWPRTVTVTCARNTATPVATRTRRDGLVEFVPKNLPRIDYQDLDGDGLREAYLLIEGQRQTGATFCRDLTNAAWTKSGITPTKDQTGVDGVASACTRLTATGSNGTVLQGETITSRALTFSLYIRRITGTGTIELTLDNGSTWTPITIMTSFTRQAILQTLANPTFGLRLGTSGDEVAVDLCNCQNGDTGLSPTPAAFVSSAILLTGSGSTTRQSEVVTVTLPQGTPSVADSYTAFMLFDPFWPRTTPTADTSRLGLFAMGGSDAFANDSKAQLVAYRGAGSDFPASLNAHGYANGNLLTAVDCPATGLVPLAVRLWAVGDGTHQVGAETTGGEATQGATRVFAGLHWRAQTIILGGRDGVTDEQGFIRLRDFMLFRGQHRLVDLLGVP